MRLIDADALPRLTQIYEFNGKRIETEIVDAKFIDNAPTVDAVPVVRCKDCTYYCPRDDGRPYECLRSGMLCVRKKDFCSFGKEGR